MSLSKYVDCSVVELRDIYNKSQMIFGLNEFFILDAYYKCILKKY